MFHVSKHPARRVAAGARAMCQGLLGVALIALAAFVFLPSAYAAVPVTLESVGNVKKGDVVDLDYAPAVGLTMTVNGKACGAPVPGADLYAALLGIFVGDRPVDPKMKAGMPGAAG